MEPEQVTQAQEPLIEPRQSVWNTVTPLSKYLAMVLFIILPFVGGWIGYTYAPEKVVEVEKVVIKEVEAEKPISQSEIIQSLNSLGYFRLSTDDNQETAYVGLGTKIYSLEGATPSNGGNYSFQEITEAYIYGGGQGGSNFIVKSYGDGSFGSIQLGIVDEERVYFKSDLLEGIDYSSMIVDTENYNVRDEDTVFFLQSDCRQEFFVEGEFELIETYQPDC